MSVIFSGMVHPMYILSFRGLKIPGAQLVLQDKRSLVQLLSPRRAGSGAKRALSSLEDASLACEADVHGHFPSFSHWLDL